MLNISSLDVENYKENGFVVSENQLSAELFNEILQAYNEFIDKNNDLSLEEMASPHLMNGAGLKHNKTRELCESFLNIGKNNEIVSQVRKILGDDVIQIGRAHVRTPVTS